MRRLKHCSKVLLGDSHHTEQSCLRCWEEWGVTAPPLALAAWLLIHLGSRQAKPTWRLLNTSVLLQGTRLLQETASSHHPPPPGHWYTNYFPTKWDQKLGNWLSASDRSESDLPTDWQCGQFYLSLEQSVSSHISRGVSEMIIFNFYSKPNITCIPLYK